MNATLNPTPAAIRATTDHWAMQELRDSCRRRSGDPYTIGRDISAEREAAKRAEDYDPGWREGSPATLCRGLERIPRMNMPVVRTFPDGTTRVYASSAQAAKEMRMLPNSLENTIRKCGNTRDGSTWKWAEVP